MPSQDHDNGAAAQCKQSSNVHIDSIVHRSVTADPSAHIHCISLDGAVRHGWTAEECVRSTRHTRGLPRNNGTTGEAGRVIWRGGRGLRVRGADRNLGQSPIERLAGAHWSLVLVLWMDVVAMDPDLADLA
jgi:hypothetical protein